MRRILKNKRDKRSTSTLCKNQKTQQIHIKGKIMGGHNITDNKEEGKYGNIRRKKELKVYNEKRRQVR